jgi:hypothetical protein
MAWPRWIAGTAAGFGGSRGSAAMKINLEESYYCEHKSHDGCTVFLYAFSEILCSLQRVNRRMLTTQ